MGVFTREMVCYCAPATYWEPAVLCGACEERMEDEERQERFEMEYAGIDAGTGYPLHQQGTTGK